MDQRPVIFLIGIILLGWSSYSMADVLSKYLSASYVVPQILMTGSLIGSIVTGVWILGAKGIKGFKSPQIKWHLLRALCVVGIAYFIVNALALLPIADVYGIGFTSPFITLILVAIFLKEPIGYHRWISVAVGFLGAVTLAGPQFQTFNIGIIYACISTICIGVSAIFIRKIGKNEYLPLYAFYPMAAIVLFMAPLAAQNFIMPSGMDILLFGLHGLSIIGGQLTVTYAIAHVKETAILSPFIYVQILWGTIFGIFLFGDIPTWTTVLGLTLIIGAGLYSIYREHLAYKKTHSL